MLGRGSERRGRNLAERALDALTTPAQILAEGRRVVHANAAFRQAFEDWAIPLPKLLNQQAVGEGASQELARLLPAGATGRIELTVATPLGEIGWRDVSVHVLPDFPGHSLWLCRDISAERRAGAALRPLVQALEK